jgi:hypothetical protein
VPNALAILWLGISGALPAWWDQVWRWGRIYASQPFLESPLRNGVVRTLDWLGFHLALLVAIVLFFLRGKREGGQPSNWLWSAWCLVSLSGVAAGWRFFPRYYFLLLAPFTLLAARGFVLAARKRAIVALLLLVPFIRFGPRYALLAVGRMDWVDIAMDRDSRSAAALVVQRARPGDTLFVWGYRPEMYVYTGLPAATRFLDSQPLTGVPADRHLTDSRPIETVAAAAHRAEMARSSPAFLIDGLGLLNPKLAITNYPDLQAWFSRYREIARSPESVIYRLSPDPARGALAEKR